MQPWSRELRALAYASSLSFFLTLPATAQGPLGTREQRINTTSHRSQVLPAADQNAAGDFVVVWMRESDGLPAEAGGLFGQLFTFDGERRGEELRIADSHAYGDAPSVALDDSGRFVVVWSDSNARGLRARRFSADEELLADEVVDEEGVRASTAVDGSGNIVVAWEHAGEVPGTEVRARRFDAGPEIWGDAFKVPEGDEASYDPAVAVAADGRFVVVYRQDGAEPGTSFLRARRFSAASEAVGEEILVAPEASSALSATPPAVEYFQALGFAVAWVDVVGEEPHLYLRTYGPGGVVRSEPFEVDGPPATPDPPRIAVLAGDEVLVVWRRKVAESFLGADGSELWGRLFDRFANPLGAAFPVTALGPGPGPALAAHPDGLFALVAFPYADDVYGRILPPEGRGGIFQLADPGGRWNLLAESEQEVTVSVLRTGGVVGRATVDLFTAERSLRPGARLATAGEDFESVATTLVFEDGEVRKSVRFGVSDDFVREGNEVFTVGLAAPTGAMLRQPSEVEVTLYDNVSRGPGEGPYPLGDAVRVAEVSGGVGRQRVAASAEGFFLVAWSDAGRVLGRLSGPDGNVRGGLLRFSDEGEQDLPAVAAAPDGRFLVAWAQDGGEVRGRWVRPAGAGAPKLGPEMALGTCDSDCLRLRDDVDVTVGPSGRFAVSWVGRSGDAFGPPNTVQARVFEPDGTPRGSKFETGSSESAAAVTWEPDGGFLLVWGDGGELEGQRFSASGERLAGGRLHLAELVSGGPLPDAATQADGSRLVVWEGPQSTFPSPDALYVRTETDVFARRFGAGATSGADTPVNSFLPGAQQWPRVAAAPSGEAVVLWSSHGELKKQPYVLFGRRLGPDGRLLGERFPVLPSRPGGVQSSPDVAFAGTGEIVVTWKEGSGIWVRRFAAGSCLPNARRLCLGEGRFALEVEWEDFAGKTGQGTPGPLSEDTGSFWFFGPKNVELVVKVLDGRGFNGRYWVFYGSLSNVLYRLRVTDTLTGAEKTYVNPLGNFASVGDTQAFPGTSP